MDNRERARELDYESFAKEIAQIPVELHGIRWSSKTRSTSIKHDHAAIVEVLRRVARAAIEGEPHNEEECGWRETAEQWKGSTLKWQRDICEALGLPPIARVDVIKRIQELRAERVLEAAPREEVWHIAERLIAIAQMEKPKPAMEEAIRELLAERAAAPLPTARELQRTAGDVLHQFRESGSEDWGELESAINWWAMNEFCPNFTKGDRAVSEGRLREALEQVVRDGYHNDTCGAVLTDAQTLSGETQYPCNCWKSKVLAELESA